MISALAQSLGLSLNYIAYNLLFVCSTAESQVLRKKGAPAESRAKRNNNKVVMSLSEKDLLHCHFIIRSPNNHGDLPLVLEELMIKVDVFISRI